MKNKTAYILPLIFILIGCTKGQYPDPPPSTGNLVVDRVRRDTGIAAAWGLARLNDVSSKSAAAIAKGIQHNAVIAVAFLATPAAETTAQKLNTLLLDFLLKDIPIPGAAPIVDAVGIILDATVGPLARTLTQAELKLLSAAISGLEDAAYAFQTDKIAPKDIPQAIVLAKNTRAPRFWLKATQ